MTEERWALVLAIGDDGLKWEAKGNRVLYMWSRKKCVEIWTGVRSNWTHILFASDRGCTMVLSVRPTVTVKYYPDLGTARVAMELLR